MLTRFLQTLSFLVIFISSDGQEVNKFIRQNYSKEISFIVMDSSNGSQSVVIEYPQFLAIIETPMIDAGGGKKHDLSDDTTLANAYLEFLRKQYPGKPVKYILSSHWHQHSMSGVSPFLRQGARLVSTAQNLNYALENGMNQYLKVSDLQQQITTIRNDTTLLSDTEFPIRVIYLDSSYNNKPTKDYLFFYLITPGILHASCMSAINSNDLQKKGKHIYHERLIDLQRAIIQKKLIVKQLIRLGREELNEKGFKPGIYSYEEVNNFIKTGQSAEELMLPYTKMSTAVLEKKRDSILTDCIKKEIPSSAINKAVYLSIQKRQYQKALIFAQLLNLISPGYLNYLDTLGEAFFVNKNITAAEFYSKILFLNDPKWDGGMKVWEENKKNNDY